MFPINTIIAWVINDYHELRNIIITNLLLPLGIFPTVTLLARLVCDVVLPSGPRDTSPSYGVTNPSLDPY